MVDRWVREYRKIEGELTIQPQVMRHREIREANDGAMSRERDNGVGYRSGINEIVLTPQGRKHGRRPVAKRPDHLSVIRSFTVQRALCSLQLHKGFMPPLFPVALAVATLLHDT